MDNQLYQLSKRMVAINRYSILTVCRDTRNEGSSNNLKQTPKFFFIIKNYLKGSQVLW